MDVGDRAGIAPVTSDDALIHDDGMDAGRAE
jgi:hypothetical protein